MKKPKLVVVSNNQTEAGLIAKAFNEFESLPPFDHRYVDSLSEYLRNPLSDNDLSVVLLSGNSAEDNPEIVERIKMINPSSLFWKSIAYNRDDLRRLEKTQIGKEEFMDFHKPNLEQYLSSSIKDGRLIRNLKVMVNGLGRFTEGLLDELRKVKGVSVHLYSENGNRITDVKRTHEEDEARTLNSLELMEQEGRLEFYANGEYKKWMENAQDADFVIFASGPKTDPEIFLGHSDDEIRGLNAAKLYRNLFLSTCEKRHNDSNNLHERNYSRGSITTSNPVGSLCHLDFLISGNLPENIFSVACEGRRFGVLLSDTLNQHPDKLEERTGKRRITYEDIIYPYIAGEHHDAICLMGLGNFWSLNSVDGNLCKISDILPDVLDKDRLEAFPEWLEGEIKSKAINTMKWAFSKGKPYKEAPLVLAEYLHSISHFRAPPSYLSLYSWCEHEGASLILPSAYNYSTDQHEPVMSPSEFPTEIRDRLGTQVKIQRAHVREGLDLLEG
ncbi:hypothetical protein GOV12_02825 [Candidatus Pacearchaeota archaeon]|nr:hypothetical protein [Candidatus Pacearchaeota archaeon]